MWPIRPPQYVGREPELAVLHAAVEALARGEGSAAAARGTGGGDRSGHGSGSPGMAPCPGRDWARRRPRGGACPLRREGRRGDAREQLRIAHEMLTELGMAAFAERARRELLAASGTVHKCGAEAGTALTAQETRIARLACDGHTNPEIGTQLYLSARTVEFHLRKVYIKLGISSRRQLPAALDARASQPASPRPRDGRPAGRRPASERLASA